MGAPGGASFAGFCRVSQSSCGFNAYSRVRNEFELMLQRAIAGTQG
jgi:hypothetical protein